jgi:hypothetical protein
MPGRQLQQVSSIVTVTLRQHTANKPSDSNTASITLAKLQNPFKQGLDRVTDDLKKIYAAHNKYGKALDKVWS